MSEPAPTASPGCTETARLLEQIVARAEAWELPAPPKVLPLLPARLLRNRYLVAVIGEAKRGKSTFVNALIGRELLPTDVDIATSQVFQVSNAPDEAYRLRFEDGSAREIGAEELPRYGSQTYIDAHAEPGLAETIRCIEVEVPAPFLPKGVTILDTPGLGALHASHARITRRFARDADAVLFVLDSQQPIGESEVEIIEGLLDVTRQFFFIQTKIDIASSEEDWQRIQARNEEILAARFGDRLPQTRVWPISSRLLRIAGATGDEEYLSISGQPELAAALGSFLTQLNGGRAAEALSLAGSYHTLAAEVLAGRLNALVQESAQRRSELRELAQKRRADFEAEWGERGPGRKALVADVLKICTLGKAEMRQALNPGERIDQRIRERIDAIQSIPEARQFAASFAEVLAAEAQTRWEAVCDHTRAACEALLAPLEHEAARVTAPGGAQPPKVTLTLKLRASDHFMDVLKGVRNEASAISGLTGLVTAVLSALHFAVAPWLIPLAGIAILAKGWEPGMRAQIEQARLELAGYIAPGLRQLQAHFLDVDLSSGRFSLVEEYFKTLDEVVMTEIAAVAQQRSEEARAEVARMAEEAAMDDVQRKQRAGAVQAQLREWTALGESLVTQAAELSAPAFDAAEGTG